MSHREHGAGASCVLQPQLATPSPRQFSHCPGWTTRIRPVLRGASWCELCLGSWELPALPRAGSWGGVLPIVHGELLQLTADSDPAWGWG